MTEAHFNTRHGHSRRNGKTPTYKAWESMHRRCYMPSQVGYEYYGGRGIAVAHEWHTFENFLHDMGEKPKGMTLERRDPTQSYSKDNCRWALPLEQARNKTTTRWLEHEGERLCLSEWAERLGVAPKTLRARLDDHGWSVERALTTPVMTAKESSYIARETKYGRVNTRREK